MKRSHSDADIRDDAPLLLAFITLAVIGALAAEGSASAAVFPSNVSLAAQ
ncbi:MAG TPA: hypothetical protein VIE47_00015 [Methylocystis sp.]